MCWSWIARYAITLQSIPLMQLLLIGCTSIMGILPGLMSSKVSPKFVDTPDNVTYNRGQLAVLKCTVKNLGTKYIVWRKASDPNPLTVGTEKYVDDVSITIESNSRTNTWNLLIKNVQPRHAGVYECQISSKDRLIRHILLRVIDNPGIQKGIFISGTRYVVRGQRIHLTCNSTEGDQRSKDINWYKGGHKIDATKSSRVFTTKYTTVDEKITVSTLTIDRSQMSDGGTYVCRASNDIFATIEVNVLNSTNVTLNGTNVKREQKVGSEQAYTGDVANRIEPIQTNNGQISRTTRLPWMPCLFFVTVTFNRFYL